MHCALLGLSKVIFGVAVHYLFCPIREIPRAIILCSVVALNSKLTSVHGIPLSVFLLCPP